MCLCTRVPVSVCAHVPVCARTRVWRPEDNVGVISRELLTLVLEAGSLTNLGSWIGLKWRSGGPQGAYGSPVLGLKLIISLSSFVWVLRTEHRSIPTSHAPALDHKTKTNK